MRLTKILWQSILLNRLKKTEEDTVQNGDGEEGTVNFWMYSGGDVQVVKPNNKSIYAIASKKHINDKVRYNILISADLMLEITSRLKLKLESST